MIHNDLSYLIFKNQTMKKILITLTALFCCQLCFSQNVGIGTQAPHSSALLDLKSNEKGFLLPRMNSTERNLIPSPATGLMVFDTDKGTIYMFDGTQWLPLNFSGNGVVTQPRGSNTPSNNSGFGYKACISGAYAAVSSCKGVSVGAGPWVDTVYIYEKLNGSWTLRTKLVQSDAVGGDGFGQSIALVGDYLLVGAPYRNNQAGAVYSFIRSGLNWTQSAILTPSNPQVGSRFGMTISMASATALIGAPSYFNNGVTQGTVYNFSRNISTWSQVQQLWGISSLQYYGEAIAISGNYALIGAPRSSYNGISNSGIAYFYTKVGQLWNATDTVYNPGAEADDEFGFSVTISESMKRAFISRPNRIAWGTNTGEVINFAIGNLPLTFVKQGVLTCPDYPGRPYFQFGHSISMYNEHLVVGGPHIYNDPGTPGRVYIFKFDNSFPDVGDKWQPWKVIKDENGFSTNWSYDTYGRSVFINGTNIVMGNPGVNHFQGRVLFMDVY
jgi:hypothetical protein